jgi:hypothetical protein
MTLYAFYTIQIEALMRRVLQVCRAIEALSQRLVGKDVEELFKNMGKTWEFLVSDPQLRWYVKIFEIRIDFDYLLLFLPGSVQKRVLFTSPPVPSTTLSGTCMPV